MMQISTLKNAMGERIDFTFEVGRERPDVVIVIGHGVTANKDRAWAVALMDALTQSGLGALRFSFAGNGASAGRFEDSCPSKEADDLRAVLKAVRQAGAEQIAYVGHSMGAAVGVMVAAQPQPGDVALDALVSLGGMVHTADFAFRKFGEQKPGNSLMWDKPECPLSQAFIDDMNKVHSVLPLAERIEIPWYLVHGSADTVVPPEESKRIAATVSQALVEVLPEVDHVFSGAAAAEMAVRVTRWLGHQFDA
jgi:uncharacterized protein